MQNCYFLLAFAAAVAALPQTPGRTPRPGVKTPGVRIPIEKLKPDAVFETGGNPDWLAIDDAAWVSNYPKDTLSRMDPRTNTVAATITVGKGPCAGLAAAFGSVWVPNCGDQTISRVDVKTNEVTATFPIGIADSEGGIAAGAGSKREHRRAREKQMFHESPFKISVGN